MKRLFFLMGIGAILFALAFACGPSPDKKEAPDEQDSTYQDTYKSDSVAESESDSAKDS